MASFSKSHDSESLERDTPFPYPVLKVLLTALGHSSRAELMKS